MNKTKKLIDTTVPTTVRWLPVGQGLRGRMKRINIWEREGTKLWVVSPQCKIMMMYYEILHLKVI